MTLPASLGKRGVLALLALTVVGVAVFTGAKSVTFQSGVTTKAGELVASLFVITVFVERSLAVLNDIWFGEQRELQERKLQTAGEQFVLTRRRLDEARATHEMLIQGTAPADAHLLQARTTALQSLDAERQRLVERIDQLSLAITTGTEAVTKIEAEQDRLRLRLGFLFALLISAAGVRTLESLLLVSAAKLAGEQLWVLHALDMVLTAGLITGGSSGVNAIADLLGRYVDVSRRKIVTG
jgi:hypothetical protein